VAQGDVPGGSSDECDAGSGPAGDFCAPAGTAASIPWFCSGGPCGRPCRWTSRQGCRPIVPHQAVLKLANYREVQVRRPLPVCTRNGPAPRIRRSQRGACAAAGAAACSPAGAAACSPARPAARTPAGSAACSPAGPAASEPAGAATCTAARPAARTPAGTAGAAASNPAGAAASEPAGTATRSVASGTPRARAGTTAWGQPSK